ncbi:beta-lactamase/transpeptidase-like protein [Mycena olivaceomarginata]|nr:beta-lactamase/transpeptidase-like protein [Mycena olivaceomarginata]
MGHLSLSAAQKNVFGRILSDAVASKSTTALLFGVTTADGPVYMRTAGTKLVGDLPSGSINEDTIFWVYSQTKLITTARVLAFYFHAIYWPNFKIAALQLIERGGIGLDTLVETILPELANPVVVTDYDGAGWVCATNASKGWDNACSVLDYWADRKTPSNDLPLAYTHRYKDGEGVSTFFKLLKGFAYRFGYEFSTDCVGFIVERLSGKSLEQYLESGVIKRWKGPSVIEQDPAHVRVHFGGVGLYASQKDYLTVLHHLLQIQAGRVANPILSYTSVDSLFAPTLPQTGPRRRQAPRACAASCASSTLSSRAPREPRSSAVGY